MSFSEAKNKTVGVEYVVLNEEHTSPERAPPLKIETDKECCKDRTPLQSPCPICSCIPCIPCMPCDSTHSCMG